MTEDTPGTRGQSHKRRLPDSSKEELPLRETVRLRDGPVRKCAGPCNQQFYIDLLVNF